MGEVETWDEQAWWTSAIHDGTEPDVADASQHVSLRGRLTAGSGSIQVPAPDEFVQTVERLGYRDDAFVCVQTSESFDQESGVSSWEATLATDSVLIEATAEATRMSTNRGSSEQYLVDWSLDASNERPPKSYRDLPKVTLRIRRFDDLSELQVVATGATDAFENDEFIRETWTFTFRDGSEPVVFEVDHSDRDHPLAVDDLCRHLAGRL